MLSGSPALSTLPELGYLIFSATLQRRCYYHTHFTDEKNEAEGQGLAQRPLPVRDGERPGRLPSLDLTSP